MCVCRQDTGKMLKRWWCKRKSALLFYIFHFNIFFPLSSFLFVSFSEVWFMKSTVYILPLWKCSLKHIKNTSALMHIISNSDNALFIRSNHMDLYWKNIRRWQRRKRRVLLRAIQKYHTIHTQMHASRQNICVYFAK